MLKPEESVICYRLLLGRNPSNQELAVAATLDHASALRDQLLLSEEFAVKWMYRYFGNDPGGAVKDHTERFNAYIGEIGERRLAQIRELIAALPREDDGSGHDYIAFHAERMLELMAFIDRWSRDRPVGSILDIGLSPFFALYKLILPSAQTFLADVWAHPEDKLQRFGVDGFFRIDLNKSAISSTHGGNVGRRFDVIVFTEVVEHLLVDPVEALTDILELLSPDGVLFFSTPNYMTLGALGKLLQRENPQPRYYRKVGNSDFHYHLREYSWRELLQAVDAAGGRVKHFALSDCWDRGQMPAAKLQALPVPLRSNVVLAITTRGAPPADQPEGEAAGTGPSAKAQPEPTADRFDEGWYLLRHPDVAEAVQAGRLRSGWEHFVRFGAKERRSWRPLA